METQKFIKYVMSFYGKSGLYPIDGINGRIIKNAICELALGGHKFSGGDSFDRKMVRDYILENNR